MFTEKGLAFIGVLLLSVGVFLPVVHEDVDDSSYNLIEGSADNKISAVGPGVYILIIAAVALLLTLVDRAEYTWATSLLMFWPLFLAFSGVWISSRNEMGTSLRIGWLVIAGGLILMLAPFWPPTLKKVLGWLDDEDDPKDSAELPQEEEI